MGRVGANADGYRAMTAAQFASESRAALEQRGWQVAEAPGGLTLAALRDAGAPFKGSKYFDRQAALTEEIAFPGGEVACRSGLIPESLGPTIEEAERLVAQLSPNLPPGTRPIVGPAALYVWLLVHDYQQRGEWLLQQCFTWAADQSGTTHLIVGVFGQQRPLLVSPLPEGLGRGVGVMPLLVPA